MFTALETATGRATAAAKPRHRNAEFLALLKQVARAHPDTELHLVMDDCAAHKRLAVKDWLAANPRVVVHLNPAHAFWMNLVRVWFSIIDARRSTAAPWAR